MSWEVFKQNILKVSNSPEFVNSTDMIADLYAKEYDAAIKRGFDSTHKISIKKGNVEMMRTMFKLALDKGLTQTGEYDLVGAMGDGVLAYWAGAVMNTIPVPIEPAKGSTANVSVTSNLVLSNGIWKKSTNINAGLGVDFLQDDTPEIEFGAVEEFELDNGEITVPESVPEVAEVVDDAVGADIDYDMIAEEIETPTYTEGEINDTNEVTADIVEEEFTLVEQTAEEKAAVQELVNNLPPPKLYGNIGADPGPLSPPPGLPKNLKNGYIPANVLAPIGNGMLLHKEAARQFLKLKAQAKKDKISFVISDAYRSYANQQRLYIKYGEDSAAKPGSSIHGFGCAIDFGEIAADARITAGDVKFRARPAVNKIVRAKNPIYRWLSVWGPKFGWYNPYRLCDGKGKMDEAWHWEYWGFFTLTAAERES
jgi:hypothetical protein